MAKKKNDLPEVKFINSLSFSCVDKDENIRHIQITVVQEIESGDFKLYFDVVDPSKIKLQE